MTRSEPVLMDLYLCQALFNQIRRITYSQSKCYKTNELHAQAMTESSKMIEIGFRRSDSWG